jgi:hypothetical protein
MTEDLFNLPLVGAAPATGRDPLPGPCVCVCVCVYDCVCV